jgi:hypothetical protein
MIKGTNYCPYREGCEELEYLRTKVEGLEVWISSLTNAKALKTPMPQVSIECPGKELCPHKETD